jgi:hypothetical protein
MIPKLTLSVLGETFAICKLDRDDRIPDWALTGDFISITRTPDELSIVCLQNNAPQSVNCDRGWKCLRVEGSLALSLTGILASLITPLSQAGISIFSMSTYETDYLLVKEQNLEDVLRVLNQEGHRIL